MSYSLCSIHYMYTCDDTRKLWLLTHRSQVCSIFLSRMYGFLRIARSDASGLDRREFIRPPSSLTHFFSFLLFLALCTVATLLSTVAGSSMGPGRGFQPRLTSARRARDHDLTSLPNLMQLFTHATLRALLSFLSLSHWTHRIERLARIEMNGR